MTNDDDTREDPSEQATAQPSSERATIPEGLPRGPRPQLELAGDRYRILEPIGRGGMGEVYAASDLQLGREVAIKRLQTEMLADVELRRFLHEARIQGRLDHPGIVPVYDLGYDAGGRPYFSMKKVTNTTLAKVLRTRKETLQRLLRAFADVCLAVEYAHVHGVIHRDLKPENIMLGDFGEVYVLDWGIAKVVGQTDEFSDLRSTSGGTMAGAVLGTPKYMSPEQARDASDVDARSDVFALGLVLEEILDSVDDPPPELVALAEAAATPHRDARLQSARDLERGIQRFLDGDRDLALRRRLAREHFEEAKTAFDEGLTDEHRRVAMRGASTAMVLDPTLSVAAELVGRLMLEPPRAVPREVELAIVADDIGIMHAQGRAAIWGAALAVVSIVPVLLALGSPIGAAIFGCVGAIAAFGMWRAMRDPKAAPPPPWVLALGTAGPIAVVSHLFGALLVAPAVAGLSAVSLAANPFLARRRSVAFLAIAFVAAIVLPAVAERIGWLTATIEVVPDGLLLHLATTIRDWMLVPLVVVFAAGMVISAIALGRFTRSQERALRQQLHLQAWQVRQLVIEPLPAV